MNRFNKLYNTIIKESQDYQDQDEEYFLDDDEEAYDWVHQAFEDNISYILNQYELTEEQQEAFQEMGMIGMMHNPDLFNECMEDKDVASALQVFLRDKDNEKKWDKLDKAIQNWVKETIENVIEYN